MSLNKINCWEILEIEVTTNKKSIKKAYHKLLRQNKPDEKPDEFKILYQAYEDALEYETYEQNSVETILDNEEQEDVFSNTHQEKLDEFVKKVNERTYQNNYIKLFNNISSWAFIEELEMDTDIELYEEASIYLFEAVSEFENKFPKELLNMEVIVYFSDFFVWQKQWQKYDKDSTIFEYLYSHNTLQEIMPNDYPLATLKNRALAFSIDIGLIVIITSLLGTLSISSVLGYYLFLQILTLGLFNLPTLGNFILKLKVFEGHAKTNPTMTARVLRIISIGLTLLTFNQLVNNFPNELVETFFWIGIIYIGLFWKYNKLIQDFLGTRVYDMSGFVKD